MTTTEVNPPYDPRAQTDDLRMKTAAILVKSFVRQGVSEAKATKIAWSVVKAPRKLKPAPSGHP